MSTQLELLEALRLTAEQLKALRTDFVEAIGYDPHEDECSIYQEVLEDADRAIAVAERSIAKAEETHQDDCQ